MLVMNDHDNYIITEFLNYVIVHNIKLFTFSSHSIHLLQLLNMKISQSYYNSVYILLVWT